MEISVFQYFCIEAVEPKKIPGGDCFEREGSRRLNKTQFLNGECAAVPHIPRSRIGFYLIHVL
jgi:hypothetical protein